MKNFDCRSGWGWTAILSCADAAATCKKHELAIYRFFSHQFVTVTHILFGPVSHKHLHLPNSIQVYLSVTQSYGLKYCMTKCTSFLDQSLWRFSLFLFSIFDGAAVKKITSNFLLKRICLLIDYIFNQKFEAETGDIFT